MSGTDVQVKGETKLPESMDADTKGKQEDEGESETKPASSSGPATRTGSHVQIKGPTPFVPQPETGQTSTAAGGNKEAEKAPAGEESR